jgi:hypothetical protein
MIRLKCISENCEYSYEISENELTEYGQYHKRCLICVSKLKVAKESLEEIIKKDLYTHAEEYINKWITELGLEGCIELVERNCEQSCYRIYKEILEKRGLKLKGG